MWVDKCSTERTAYGKNLTTCGRAKNLFKRRVVIKVTE